jgi:transcriptional regulator with XRE-family HTH domain
MTPSELRAIRGDLGWSQSKAAALLGFSFRRYRYIEQGVNAHGKAQPVVPAALALAVLAYGLAIEIAATPPAVARLAAFRRAVFAQMPGRKEP